MDRTRMKGTADPSGRARYFVNTDDRDLAMKDTKQESL